MSSISNNKSEEVSRMLESYHRLQKYCHQGGKKATKTTPILQNENAEEQKKDTLRVEGKTVPLAIKKKYSFNSSVYSESCERDFFHPQNAAQNHPRLLQNNRDSDSESSNLEAMSLKVNQFQAQRHIVINKKNKPSCSNIDTALVEDEGDFSEESINEETPGVMKRKGIRSFGKVNTMRSLNCRNRRTC